MKPVDSTDLQAGEERHGSPRAGVEATLAELVALAPVARRLGDASPARASARLSGAHRSGLRGRGIEFAEVRAYAPGDEVRHIDWRVTARTGSPHSKVFDIQQPSSSSPDSIPRRRCR